MKSKQFALPALVAAAIVLITFYFYGRHPIPNGLEVSPPETAKAGIPVPEPSANPKLKYKTVTDETLGVSFSVPETWEAADSQWQTVSFRSPDWEEGEQPPLGDAAVLSGAQLSVWVKGEEVDASIEDQNAYVAFEEQLREDCSNCLSGQRIFMDRIPAYLGFNAATDDVHDGQLGFVVISFIKDGKEYQVSMYFSSYTPENQEILAKLIHSFRFTQ